MIPRNVGLDISGGGDPKPSGMSPRSVLYNIKPIGLGIEDVEALSNYIAAVAAAHHVRPGKMVHELFGGTGAWNQLFRAFPVTAQLIWLVSTESTWPQSARPEP